MHKATLFATIVSGLLVFYYFLKPALPLRFRYLLRRQLASWTRKRTTDWPIKPGTETPPANWPGWPEGRRFAFVITHDVEDRRGLDRCRQLMSLEERLGFKSSFNFIPEGKYRVSDELRAELAHRGFEVGVHDLYHDGSLFRSWRNFQAQAVAINHHLKNWNAAGFRAGFMFHNLSWLCRLEVRYDSSTFDVDPFEPQPHGVDTIFPFWVAGDGRASGYMELPYTLVQDSTLFLLLREQTINLWKQKLDWVAQHGGMALINIHPDYVNFEGQKPKWDTYPSSLYAELLEYVRTKYQGQYWQPLPREVADYCATFKPALPPRAAQSLSEAALLDQAKSPNDPAVRSAANA